MAAYVIHFLSEKNFVLSDLFIAEMIEWPVMRQTPSSDGTASGRFGMDFVESPVRTPQGMLPQVGL
jgi:hypothetical protein